MRLPAVLAVAVLALCGCGGADPPSDRERVGETIDDYVAAVGGERPERVCDLIVTASGRRPLASCRRRLRRGRVEPLGQVRVTAIRVRGARASARAGTERVDLRRVDGRWRIVVPG